MTAEESIAEVSGTRSGEPASGEVLNAPQAQFVEDPHGQKAKVKFTESSPKLPKKSFPLPKYHLPEIDLVDRYADEPRKLRVAVIGAGLSGVTAGVLLPAKVPGIELTIFEKNADVVSEVLVSPGVLG